MRSRGVETEERGRRRGFAVVSQELPTARREEEWGTRVRGEVRRAPETRPSVSATITSSSSLCAAAIWTRREKRREACEGAAAFKAHSSRKST